MSVLNPSITELTTAATDAVMAGAALGCIVALRRYRPANQKRVRIWTWALALMALASGLGVLAHGFDLHPEVRSWLWRPLYLSLALLVAMFVIGALFDFRGEQAARRLTIPMLGLAVGFFAITQLGSGSFRVFVAYEGVAMVAALAMYLWLALTGRLQGSGLVTFGIVLNLAAASIQVSETLTLTVVVPFDHNGVFHLVQTIALAPLFTGLSRGMIQPIR